MQGNFFNNKNNNANSHKLLSFDPSRKSTPIIPSLDDDEYSNNVLNTGFIAEDSKYLRSDSLSENSDGFSISGISEIRDNSKGSPHLMGGFDE